LAARVWPKSAPEQGGTPLDQVAQYGGGERDPITGLYEWYEEVPKELTGAGGSVSWSEIIGNWDALEFSFTAIGVDLEASFRCRSYRWFKAHVRGLLSTDSLIARCLAPEPEETPHE
jgi:hypothetical protein